MLLRDLGSDGSEVTILFSDDKELRDLNSQFRGKDKATDVLSFPDGESEYLGDIAISVQTARRQAREYSVTLREELVRLIIHGILHLHGFDHVRVSKSEANKMRRKENLYFSMIMESL